MRCLPDRAEILSGVFHGVTTGTPLAILIRNTDARSAGMEAANFFLRQGGYRSYGYVPDFRGRTMMAIIIVQLKK